MPVNLDARGRANRLAQRAPLRSLGALASVGIVAGHTLTYWAVAPGATHREALLAATGHAYWHAAVIVAAVSALWAVGSQVFRQVRAVVTGSSSLSPPSFVRRLVALQIVGFVAMEVTERLTAGASLSTHLLLDNGTLVLGSVIQVAVALILARAVEWLGRTTRRLAARFLRARPRLRRVRTRWVESTEQLPASFWWRPNAIRGPPQVSVFAVLT